jgi:hypothetical protein
MFGLTSSGWLRSITLTPTYSIISYGITLIYAHFLRNATRA